MLAAAGGEGGGRSRRLSSWGGEVGIARGFCRGYPRWGGRVVEDDEAATRVMWQQYWHAERAVGYPLVPRSVILFLSG